MKQAQVEPSADTYTALLNAFAEKKDVESMRQIYEDCKKSDVDFSDKDHLEVIVCLSENGYEGEFFDEVSAPRYIVNHCKKH
jgi:pentatricopeptide repeat protein